MKGAKYSEISVFMSVSRQETLSRLMAFGTKFQASYLEV
jgi:hypothetical protein